MKRFLSWSRIKFQITRWKYDEKSSEYELTKATDAKYAKNREKTAV